MRSADFVESRVGVRYMLTWQRGLRNCVVATLLLIVKTFWKVTVSCVSIEL